MTDQSGREPSTSTGGELTASSPSDRLAGLGPKWHEVCRQSHVIGTPCPSGRETTFGWCVEHSYEYLGDNCPKCVAGREASRSMNPNCTDARSEGWSCVESDGTGLWCDSCLAVGREATCVQATDEPEMCCFDLRHGASTARLVLAYGESRLVVHTVCDGCADDAEAGRLPDQHSDADLLRVYR